MKILLLAQYFTPELTAGAARIHSFGARLAAIGHAVRVICEIPNHPRGVIEEGYGGRAFDHRSFDGFDVTYVWVPTNSVKTTRSRVAGYGTYALMASIAGALASRPDVVFASSPPLPVGAAARVVAGRHRVPWVLDVRDLWPAAAVAVGELRGKRIIAAASRLEHSLYRSAAAITTPSGGSREWIVSTGVRPEKVHVVTSGTTPEWLDLGNSAVERAPLGLPADEFVWTYAGNIGLAQDVGTAIRAAAELGAGYQLLVVGDGPLRTEMEKLAARLAPNEVRFTGLVPPITAGRHMRASDALLVSLANVRGLEYAVPSKLYDCCATGRPMIVAAKGEVRRLSEHHAIALTVDPGDAASLAAAVRRLRTDAMLRARLVIAARQFAQDHLRERQADRLAEVLASVIRSRRSRPRRSARTLR
jgi:colanic acid biosynthesis glycosyl transferase WcaI